jgi:DNA polymerase-1
MFFDDLELVSRKSATLRTPPIPETGWRPPSEFPDLTNAEVISFDTETRELDFDHGPGWARGKGHIVGISIAARLADRGTYSVYIPFRHEIEKDWNRDVGSVLGWIKHSLSTPRIPKVGANLLYDIGWLAEEGIEVKGDLYDVQFAEALLDETAPVNLEALGKKYVGEGKDSNILYEWLSQAYGGQPNGLQRANIYRAPPRLVGPYAESDATLPLTILERQWPLLAAEGLIDLFKMECASIPMLIKMRQGGVRVDVGAAEKLHAELGVIIPQLYGELAHISGVHIESVNAAAQVARVFDAVGVAYPRTADGAPSFRKEWLSAHSHPVAAKINEIREHEKIRGTFIESYILNSHNNGRLHCQFHPLRGESGGAKTGRYSSSDPNLQNIPTRTELGKKIRKLFVPDEGHLCFEKNDHSQIEYRMLAHFAVGPGSEELRATYRRDPRTDYHDRVFQKFCAQVGLDYAHMGKEEKATRRKPLKNINFGLIYGQSQSSLAYKAGMSKQDADEFFETYHESAPYVKPTMAAIAASVQELGYIQTILGRRVRFNLWEPRRHERGVKPLPYRAALAAYGSNIKRAGDYKGTNYTFQGSAADVMKAGMLRAYRDGVFDVIGFPKMQVHDELDFSVISDNNLQKSGYSHLRHCLENAIPTVRVPLFVDSSRGANWGECD